jgi:protein tyrosine phosphatase (PTP) superfamily phosphohydrolase (DUF442 family)
VRTICRLIFTMATLGAAPMVLYGAAASPIDGSSSKTIKELLKVDVPVVLCIDDKPTAGGQPSAQAYAQAAANGYRSILTLRREKDGVDLLRERAMVERQKMRYFNIPVAPDAPRRAQVDEFLALVRDRNNHPMLINCAYAERVAPLMMIFRIVEEGWSKEKALKEAVRMGVKKEPLEKFADSYLARRRANPR